MQTISFLQYQTYIHTHIVHTYPCVQKYYNCLRWQYKRISKWVHTVLNWHILWSWSFQSKVPRITEATIALRDELLLWWQLFIIPEWGIDSGVGIISTVMPKANSCVYSNFEVRNWERIFNTPQHQVGRCVSRRKKWQKLCEKNELKESLLKRATSKWTN